MAIKARPLRPYLKPPSPSFFPLYSLSKSRRQAAAIAQRSLPLPPPSSTFYGSSVSTRARDRVYSTPRVLTHLADPLFDFFRNLIEQRVLDPKVTGVGAPPAASHRCTSTRSATPSRHRNHFVVLHAVIHNSEPDDHRSDKEHHGRAASPPTISSPVTSTGEVRNPSSLPLDLF